MNLLITGAWRHTPAQLDTLRQMGHTLLEMPDERGELPCSPDWVEGVICNGLFLYHPIESFTSLTYVQLTSAGLDRMPMAYAAEKGITVHNARGVYSIPMAEFALASVLSVYKESRHFAAAQSGRRWDKHRGLRELYGKRVCIVGCGSVGTECAVRFAAMGCEVVGVDLFPREDEHYAVMLPIGGLDTALMTADVLVLTLPLTEETYHLMNRERLGLLPDGCVLVNIARGGILDTEALAEALQKRPITAVLDVFEEEPLGEDSPLWGMDNAVLTPHNSFVGEGNPERLWGVIRRNLTAFANHS
jgi:phosphoglycerate dehydrogenase-like enzyme